jgi:rubrerythrin
MSTTPDPFTPNVSGQYPKLASLYEKAKKDFWNESTEVDWSLEITLPEEKRRALAQLLSITYYGERAAVTIAAQLVASVQDEDARRALACQVIEETKHVAAFERLLGKLDRIYPPSFFARRLLNDLIATEDPAAKMVGMHLFVENIANQTFQMLREPIDDPLVSTVLEYIARDERKHTAIAVLYLPALLEDLSAAQAARLQMKQLKWLSLGIGMVKDGYEQARALDVDLAAAGQKALRHHYRLRDQMASKRGLLDIPGFEKAIDVIGRWATPR